MLPRRNIFALPLLLLAFAGPAFGSDQPTNQDKPKQKPVGEGLCKTLYDDMEYAVEQMDKANQEMEDAYNSGDLDEMGKASGRFDAALRTYNDKEDKFTRGDCYSKIYKNPPTAPKKWDPSG